MSPQRPAEQPIFAFSHVTFPLTLDAWRESFELQALLRGQSQAFSPPAPSRPLLFSIPRARSPLRTMAATRFLARIFSISLLLSPTWPQRKCRRISNLAAVWTNPKLSSRFFRQPPHR